MRVVGRQRLQDLYERHAEAKQRVLAWLAEVEDAVWKSPQDIRRRFTTASFLGDNVVVFNIGGNRYRVATKILYEQQQVLVVRAGTHDEYDSWTF